MNIEIISIRFFQNLITLPRYEFFFAAGLLNFFADWELASRLGHEILPPNNWAHNFYGRSLMTDAEGGKVQKFLDFTQTVSSALVSNLLGYRIALTENLFED
jgi:hypothetical protein